MNIGWNFPKNNDGEIVGVGEAGIETFKGSLLGSLAREICQNSLDARKDTEKAVKVEFILESVKREDVVGIEVLSEILNLCKSFWMENKKTVDFFDKASMVCDSDFIRILRISDYNTTGLTGSDKIKSSPWQDLVKSSGVSNKMGESGGSFGIGKSAPFACSNLRTIFYSTLDIDGLRASQGVARLVSFEREDDSSRTKVITQGKGYYGDVSNNSPLKELMSFGNYERQEVGTDVYILGFIQQESWEEEIIKELIEGYLISILRNDLIVKVNSNLMNSENIGEYIDKYKEDIPLAYNYYQVLTSKESITINQDFENLGEIELKIMIKKDFRRRVLMSRNNGMKIFDKKNISGTIPFAGVCILKDIGINEFFREMENPQHNNWEEERHSDVKKAKKIKKKLFEFIKEKVFEVGKMTILDEMDAVGAGDIIPDLEDSLSNKDSHKEQIGRDVIDYSPLEKNTKIFSQMGEQATKEADIAGYMDEYGYVDTNSDELDADRVNYYKDGNLSGENVHEESLSAYLGDKEEKIRKATMIKPFKLRLFMYNSSKLLYKLSFETGDFVSDAFIEIYVSGEQSNQNIEINFASNDNGQLLKYKNNRFYVGNLENKKKYTFIFGINYKEICSMEVSIRGYKIQAVSPSGIVG